jgi:hypothetical protein
VELGAAAAAADEGAPDAPPPAVTSGVIFFIVVAEIPAFDKSSTEEYGRPLMIFLAVAAPTPGRVSNSFSVAVFRSTFPGVAVAFLLLCAAATPTLITPKSNVANKNPKTRLP